MKKILQLFLIFCSLFINNYAQTVDKVSVDEYVNFLQEVETKFLKRELKGFSAKETFSKKEINNIKRMIFLARRNERPKFSKPFSDEKRDIENAYRNNNDRNLFFKQRSHSKRSIETELFKILKNNIPSLEYKLLDESNIANILFKGKVIERTIVNESLDDHIPELADLKTYVHYVKFEVEEVIFGDGTIKNGDIVNTYYMGYWTSEGNLYPNPDIDGTETYLIKLRENSPEGGNPRFSEKLRYAINKDSFPIVNSYVIDTNEYFESGTKIEWKELKTKLRDTINDILNKKYK